MFVLEFFLDNIMDILIQSRVSRKRTSDKVSCSSGLLGAKSSSHLRDGKLSGNKDIYTVAELLYGIIQEWVRHRSGA